MTESQTAILDILDALDEYGTAITLKRVVEGEYDPTTGDTLDVVTEYPMKAFIGQMASEKMANDPLVKTSSYDAVFELYHTEKVTKGYLIEYGGFDYTILAIDSPVLQGDALLYECVAKK